MLVEHSFVTTLDGDSVMERATAFLDALGFVQVTTDSKQDRLYRRGGVKVRATTHFGKLPQQVHLAFDRGRVEVAASIHEHKKVHDIHRQLMMAIVVGLEAVIAESQSPETARREFDIASEHADAQFRKRRLRDRILWGIFISFLIGCVILIYFAIR